MASINSETYKQKTGKTLRQWFSELDLHQAKGWAHKEIVNYLEKKHKLDAWWAQMITVEFEKHLGKRTLGQTQDAGFEIGIQRTISIDSAELWEWLLSAEGAEVWLGIRTEIPARKGASFLSRDGSYEVRSIVEGRKIRLRKTYDNSASTIQLYLTPKKEKTALLVHHERLEDSTQREKMKRHWQNTLQVVKTITEKKEQS